MKALKTWIITAVAVTAMIMLWIGLAAFFRSGDGFAGMAEDRGQKIQQLKAGLDKIYENPIFLEGKHGILVKSLESGAVLYERNANQLLSPASGTKVITTAAALDRWGPSHYFKTAVYTDGMLKDGVVQGNLYMKGFGDPYLVTETMYKIVNHLVSAGIREVTGDVIADDTYLQDTENAVTDQRAYSAPGGALSFNFNTIVAFVRPGEKIGDPGNVFTEPRTEFVRVVNQTRTVAGSGSTIGKHSAAVSFADENTLTVFGDIGINAEESSVYRRMNSPALYTATVFREMLETHAVLIRGNVRKGVTPEGATTIHEFGLHNTSFAVKSTNKWSNNFIAAQLLMIMGAEEHGTPGTDEKGLRVVKKFLQKTGVDSTGFVLYDGAGLDERNKISPAVLVQVLSYMYGSFTLGPEFVSSLSIAGVDGTLEKRFRDSEAKGFLRMKDGYLWGISSLSGYARTAGGEVLVFSMITNGFDKNYYESVKQLERNIMETLVAL